MGVISKKKVFYLALIAFTIMVTINYSDKILMTAEVFKRNVEIEKIEKQGYKSYSALDGAFRFSLPSGWNAWEQDFSGGEVVYHLYFISPNKRIHGFIQAWKMEKSLKEFIEDSEKSPVDSEGYESYSKQEVIINEMKGFLVQYERPNNKGVLYKSYDCLLENDDGIIYRACFSMQKKHWKNYNTIIFNKIIKSFKVK
ncbi:MAG: hypothetical protein M0P77_06725 [Firmicutes bacterium]|nr:hypothetical protein [Bacillota bacterium]